MAALVRERSNLHEITQSRWPFITGVVILFLGSLFLVLYHEALTEFIRGVTAIELPGGGIRRVPPTALPPDAASEAEAANSTVVRDPTPKTSTSLGRHPPPRETPVPTAPPLLNHGLW